MASVKTRYWSQEVSGTVRCLVCPHRCQLKEGQRGVCFVRGCEDGQVVLTTYGKSSGFCIDPIEKKPLFHFLPGSGVLSFGTAGCNLACKFCQNWDISKSRDAERLNQDASPQRIALAAKEAGAESVAFTYNEPVIFLEYAVDTAQCAHELGLKTVAVTAGYILAEPREEFFRHIDAANVDLKAFSEEFYHKMCGAELGPVLDTLLYLKHESRVWLEITTLLIPGFNDSSAELERETAWIYENLSSDVPLHFTAFHPDFRLKTVEQTPPSTLKRAREIALKAGLKYVYVGNVNDESGLNTYCSSCSETLIVRHGYDIKDYKLDNQGRCYNCKTVLPGVFDGQQGTWGARRLPLMIT